MSANKTKINKDEFSKSLISILIVFVFVVTTLFYPIQIKTEAAIPTFTDISTAEEDIGDFIQAGIDGMVNEIKFKTTGVEIAKLFLAYDENSDKFLKDSNDKFIKLPFLSEIIDSQLMSMFNGEYNGYTRLAVTGWGTNISMQVDSNGDILPSAELTYTYSFNWSDGTNARAARDAVDCFNFSI